MYRPLPSKYSENAVFGGVEMVQCKFFFLSLSRSMFLAELREYIFYNVE